ncbi:glutamate decarboxylase 1-like [Watersipora subatra]|uniref:glutamate decarboxylase 1-like n=1 Tax=Watersipora subatra TaxID=2589382 RepID=UPI00355C0F81
MHKQQDRSTKVLDFHHPHHLNEMMSHCLEIPNEGVTLEQVLSDCKETMKYGVRTGHPRFFNQLSSGLDLISVAGEWLTATVNTNMFTYEIAPTFTLMESLVMEHMVNKIGWNNGDGIFAPGGTISNLYALLLARYKFDPAVKTDGIHQYKFVVFTSEHSHYSIEQAGSVCGLGTKNVKSVEVDARTGKMNVDCLEKHITQTLAEGKVPIMVNATASTTVYGAFDPINDIADICEKYKIWFHVDGAWGGGYLLSHKYKYKLAGIQRADSVTWNPHKLMGQTLQCSALLTKHQGLLKECNSMCANYLFQTDKQYDMSYDTGDKTMQCGRRNDIFKLWLSWRAKGDVGYEEQINQVHSLSRYLLERLRKLEEFELCLQPESTNVCFWYIPPSLRNRNRGAEWDRILHKVAPKIKAAMMQAGTVMIGYQPLADKPNFFRYVCANPAATRADVDFLLKEISRLGDAEEEKGYTSDVISK